MVSGCCITMLRHTKRPLFDNIWTRKRLSSFFTLPIRQILPLVTFSYFRGSKTPCKYQMQKIWVWSFSSVWTVCLEKIMKTHLKKMDLKITNFVYRTVVSILKDCDNYFGTVLSTLNCTSCICMRTTLVYVCDSYLNKPAIHPCYPIKYWQKYGRK
jgi:hypothetical protein